MSLELHITGPDGTQVLEISDEPLRIGRSPDNDVALIEDNTLSRQHCIVEIRNGNLYVRDLNSRHGTWTRGKKLKIHRVSEGDIVFAGRSRLVFLPPGAKTPPMPKPRGAPGPGARRPGSAHSTQAGPGPRSSEHRKRRPESPEARPQRQTSRLPKEPPQLDETENFPAATEKEVPRSEPPPPPPPPPRKMDLDPPEQSRQAPVPRNDPAPRAPARDPEPIKEVDPLVYEKPPPPRPADRTIIEGDELPPLLGGEPLFPIGWQGKPAPADPSNQAQMLLNKARQLGASDVHVSPGLPFTMRVNGDLRSMGEPLNVQDVETLIDNVCTVDQRHFFNCTGDYDYCYDYDGGGRFRTNICRHRTGNALTFRLIKEKVLHLAELGISEDAAKLTEFATGLVLLTGPMGAGKTTTMMSLARLVNEDRPDHLITVEDPIEFLLPPAKCQVSQRQLGIHTQSFDAALRAALREDPDIIVIGDMRDYETTSLAISASETGHLVFASMHAMNCMKTLDKLIDMFPAAEQNVIRVMISESLRGIVCQRLVPALGGGRVPAVELLFNSVAIGNIIRENKVANLVNAMQLGRAQGMQTLDMALQNLLDEQKISAKVAFNNAENKDRFRARMLREEEENLGERGGESEDYGED